MASGAGQRVFTSPLVTTIGSTIVPLSPVDNAVKSIVIQADPSNVGSVAIGDETVTLSTGMLLGPGDSMTLSAEPDSRYNDIDLSEVYAFSATSGNTLRIMGFRRRV